MGLSSKRTCFVPEECDAIRNLLITSTESAHLSGLSRSLDAGLLGCRGTEPKGEFGHINAVHKKYRQQLISLEQCRSSII